MQNNEFDGEEGEKGYPIISFQKPSDEQKELVNAYFRKWQKPTFTYAWRMGITGYIPEFVAELISEEVCPVFTKEQIDAIYTKIFDDKVIPVLNYAPVEIIYQIKQIWWIVPFCIWKEEVASMVIVDKNGFHALQDNDGVVKLELIFPWEKVKQLDIEYEVGDDYNICRLTLSQENGGYLTFDEFLSEEEETNHGSYLRIIEAIWEASRETIEASSVESVWLEGEGGETFEFYDHPSGLYQSKDEKIAETIQKIRTLLEFYTENLGLEKENANSLEYKLISEKEKHFTCVIELLKSNQIQFFFKTSNEKIIQNTENEGYLTKYFENSEGHIRYIGNPTFEDPLKAIKSFYDALTYCLSNGEITEINDDSAYYVGLNYYADHPFDEIKYDINVKSLKSAKEILLLRPSIKKYIKVIKDCNSVSIELVNSVLELITKEQLMLNELRLNHVGILTITQALIEEFEKNGINQELYENVIARLSS